MSLKTSTELSNKVLAETKGRHQAALDDAQAKQQEYEVAQQIEINFFKKVKYFESQYKSNPNDAGLKNSYNKARSLFSDAQISTDVLRFSYQSRLSYASKMGQSAFLANAILGNIT